MTTVLGAWPIPVVEMQIAGLKALQREFKRDSEPDAAARTQAMIDVLEYAVGESQDDVNVLSEYVSTMCGKDFDLEDAALYAVDWLHGEENAQGYLEDYF